MSHSGHDSGLVRQVQIQPTSTQLASNKSEDKKPSIHDLAFQCLEAFKRLKSSILSSASPTELISPLAIDDENGRFRGWASNIGVLKTDRSSLDFRLRDVNFLVEHVMTLLEILHTSLSEVTDIVAGDKTTSDAITSDENEEEDDSESSSDSDDSGRSQGSTAPLPEVQKYYLSIVDAIDRLYKLSVVIRSPQLRNRSTKAETFIERDKEGRDVSAEFESYAITRAIHQMRTWKNVEGETSLKDEEIALATRLGKANSRRRRQFMYDRRHHRKLAHFESTWEDKEGESLPMRQIAAMEDASQGLVTVPVAPTLIAESFSNMTAPTFLSTTTATKYVEQSEIASDNRSTVSGSTAYSGYQMSDISIPEAPEDKFGKEFQCPYCYMILPAKTRRADAWRKHVLKDLQPYICIFDECPTQDILYDSQEAWLKHEQWEHAYQWCCDSEDHPLTFFPEENAFKNHMQKNHANTVQVHQLQALADASKRPSLAAFTNCPLCGATSKDLADPEDSASPDGQSLKERNNIEARDARFVTSKAVEELQKHVASHLTQSAMIALPGRDDLDEAKSASNVGSQKAKSDTFDIFDGSIDELEMCPFIETCEVPADLPFKDNTSLWQEVFAEVPGDRKGDDLKLEKVLIFSWPRAGSQPEVLQSTSAMPKQTLDLDQLPFLESLAKISGTCLRVLSLLRGLEGTFASEKNTIRALSNVTTFIETSLENIHFRLLKNPQILSDDIHTDTGLDPKAMLRVVLNLCFGIYSRLDVEVQRLNRQTLMKRESSYIKWNDELMNDLLNNLQSQKMSISLLVSVIDKTPTSDDHRDAPETSTTSQTTESSESSISKLEIAHPAVEGQVFTKQGTAVGGSARAGNFDYVQLPSVSQSAVRKKDSASGYRACSEAVMGLWAKGTHRKFKLQEFRYEVVYETPIFFTSHPANSRGPIQGREIHYVDGSEHSYKNTRVLGPIADRKLEAERNARTDTADDERASWLTLLSVLQLEEVRSRQWDWDYRNETPPRSYTPAIQAPDYPLAVGIQSKTSSWDFVPASINKPYATTAVCHLIEMMGMVGVYWKLFDAITWNLRAEGNGLFLISRMAPDLGIYVIFGISGKMRFEENRVIPTMALKELCFGIVPNIFEDGFYLDRNRDAKSLVLNFGGHDSVLTTLESLGCHSNTLKQWKRGHSHIFSVSFEIIGMLSQVFRIRGSNFRMIPNPTQDPWLKCPGSKMSWKMARLLEMFRHKTIELVEKEEVLFEENVRIIRQIAELEQWTSDERGLSTEIREAIHDEIDVISQYLLRISQREVLSVVSAHISKVTAALDDPGSPLNSLDLANKEEAMMSFYFYEIRPAVTRKHEKSKPPLTKVERQRRNNIWIALVFRMLCWLTLHDFDANDVNIVPSELRGSRIPVYIG